MKRGVHPDYHKVCFVDSATGDEWISYSTLRCNDSKLIDGEDVPVTKLEISAASHPFWTGHSRELDAEGRIDRFRRRYAGKKAKSK